MPCIRRRREICHTHEMASYVLSALPLVRKLARSRGYDINHTHFILPTGVIARILKSLTGLPYVITSHGSDVPGYNPDRFKRTHSLARPVSRWVVNGASGITAPSTFQRDLIMRSHPRASVEVIPHGLDAQRLSWDGPKEKRILVVTRMLPRKGVQYLLQALQTIDSGDFRVDVVGDGPFLSDLQRMARPLGSKVKFWGWIDNGSPDFLRLYERASIFVLTSEVESFGMVLLEAMSAGLAIITTKGTECEKVVGEHAVLVPPRDPAALREALLRLMRQPDLRSELGAKARQRVERHFAWGSIVDRYVRLFAEAGTSRTDHDSDVARAKAGSTT